MDVRQLRYFATLAEEKHFGRAAKRLGMSQPPLSLAIRQIEAELQTPLFSRNSRNVELTRAGVALQREARLLLRHPASGSKMTRVTQCMVRPRGARGFRRSGRCGLASMYPAFDWSVVLRAHHGYQRASVLITGQASTDHLGHQVSRAPGRPNLHLLFILSQTLAGKRAIRECYTA